MRITDDLELGLFEWWGSPQLHCLKGCHVLSLRRWMPHCSGMYYIRDSLFDSFTAHHWGLLNNSVISCGNHCFLGLPVPQKSNINALGLRPPFFSLKKVCLGHLNLLSWYLVESLIPASLFAVWPHGPRVWGSPFHSVLIWVFSWSIQMGLCPGPDSIPYCPALIMICCMF